MGGAGVGEEGEWGGAGGVGAGGEGGEEGLGRVCAVGRHGVGGGGRGVGACGGAEGVCGDGVEVWLAVEVCLWACQGMSWFFLFRPYALPFFGG